MFHGPTVLHPALGPAWVEAMVRRADQIDVYGHSLSADDARGPHPFLREAAAILAAAADMALGDPARLTKREQGVLRRRVINAVALAMAGLDTFDRALARQGADDASR